MSQENADILEFYFDKFDTIYVEPIIFLEFTAILICVFLIRYNILYKIERNKLKKKNPTGLKNIRLYIGGHCILELLCSYLVCYCLIKLTHANPTSYIINMIASPIIGTLVAVYLDNKVLIPIENTTGVGNVFDKFNKKKDSSGEKKESGNSVTININGSNTEQSSNYMPSMKLPDYGKLGNLKEPEMLSEDLADSDEFDNKIIKTINSIKTENANQNALITEMKLEQERQSKEISENSKRLESTINDLNILKQSEMINKKIELKKMIYDCLNQGFATPDQNDKITMYYQSYIALGGNHEIESLYQAHYLNLEVHEDRRKVTLNIDQVYGDIYQANGIPRDRYIDPSKQKRVYSYGEFDTEFVDTNDVTGAK